MSKFLWSIITVIAVCFLFFWMSQSPTKSPDDVEITTFLNIIPSTEKSIENEDDKLKLTIFLDNKSSKPLVNEDKDYFYTVYIYNPQSYIYVSHDYSNEIYPNDIHIGGNSRTAKEANNNLIKNANVSLLNENNQVETDGFMYTGKKFPFYINYYFDEKPEYEQSNDFYVIFSYYEKRFGKNLSWSKIYPVRNVK